MPRGQLFEYAILFHPKEKKDTAGNVIDPQKSVIVQQLTEVLATSEKEVSILAARAIPEQYADKLDDVEICIRPL